ncbi:DUF4270 family protein [Mangrovivirga sp. M17]|uniref:DUF4270 family protein n=1 Tax=Mangrovivirga halotolerans TaxID=2993936 RepID=A0ABT3RT74_9BACT|nr:DUF4270 family protein [Mangrovivirga halotolerans]MCX2744841.1 DUF4270 family protein [Mangrovivirga halotolerans]
MIFTMNLQFNKTFFTKGPALLCLALLFFSACEDPTEVGLEIDQNIGRLQTLVRNIDLDIKQVQVDSVISSRSLETPVGSYTDPEFGTVESIGYYSPNPPEVSTFEDRFDETSVLDSIKMFVPVSKKLNPKNNLPGRFSVHELTEVYPDREYRYTFDHLTYDPTILGDTVVVEERDSLETITSLNLTFNLSNDFGQKIFDEAIKKESGAFGDTTAFKNFLKGIAIVPDEIDNSAYYINNTASPRITLYFRENAQDTTSEAFTVYLTTQTFGDYHNALNIDRSGTDLSTIPPFDVYESDLINDKVFVQPITGLTAKLDLSDYRSFVDSLNSTDIVGFQINHAEIAIMDVPSKEDEEDEGRIAPPEEAYLYYTSNSNNLFFSDVDSTLIRPLGVLEEQAYEVLVFNAPYQGTPTLGGQEIDNLFAPVGPVSYVEGDYKKLMTMFLQAESQDLTPEYNLLLFGSPFQRVNLFNRIVTTGSKVQLKVYYSILQE